MPEYIRRTVDSFRTEYAHNQMNPEGNLFRCVFCDDFFKTKSGRLSHMKRCCLEETEDEFDLDMTIYAGEDTEITLPDFLQSEEAEHATILQLIATNELEAMAATATGEQITRYIVQKLVSNGFCIDPDSYSTDFQIYRFFFVVTDDVKKDWVKRKTEKILRELGFD